MSKAHGGALTAFLCVTRDNGRQFSPAASLAAIADGRLKPAPASPRSPRNSLQVGMLCGIRKMVADTPRYPDGCAAAANIAAAASPGQITTEAYW